jgi:hypothetical protein
VKVNGVYDIRGNSGYIVVPPSPDRKWIVPIVDVDELPWFDTRWLPDKPSYDSSKEIADGEKYINHITAVSGEGGSNSTWRAICTLRDSGMNSVDAMMAILAWNKSNALPPWREAELARKVKEAYNG